MIRWCGAAWLVWQCKDSVMATLCCGAMDVTCCNSSLFGHEENIYGNQFAKIAVSRTCLWFFKFVMVNSWQRATVLHLLTSKRKTCNQTKRITNAQRLNMRTAPERWAFLRQPCVDTKLCRWSWCWTGWAALPGRLQEPGPLTGWRRCQRLHCVSEAERRKSRGIYSINWSSKLQQVGWVGLRISHPKSPKPKDNDNEVDDISEEHECIDIGGSPVLSVENTPEEPLSWPVNTLDTAEQNKMAHIKALHSWKTNHISVGQCFFKYSNYVICFNLKLFWKYIIDDLVFNKFNILTNVLRGWLWWLFKLII